MPDTNHVIATVLSVLGEDGSAIQKITIQKFLYFVSIKGYSVGLSFEPHTYGPFSFDLARALNRMAFWEELKETKTCYEIISLEKYQPISSDIRDTIKRYFDEFKAIVRDFTFDNLECIGTALYCAESILFQGKQLTFKSLEKEFKGWKGERYSADKIRTAFERIRPVLEDRS